MPDPEMFTNAASAGKPFVIVNPASAAGKTKKRLPVIERALSKHLGTFDLVLTERPDHGTELAHRALESERKLVIAIGGDGTFNEVANGFFDGANPRRPEAILGFISHGTGCDLVRTLAPDHTLESTCAKFAKLDSRPMDVGHVSFRDHQGVERQRIFLNVWSFGCGGAVSAAIKNKRLGGKLAFQITSAKVLMAYRDLPVSLRVDGSEEKLDVTNVAICNARFFGGGMMVAPDAKPDDGRFELTIWQGFGLKDFVFKRGSLYNGKHVNLPGTRTGHTREFTACSDETVLLDIDGENPGTLPIKVKPLPGALNVIA